MEMNVNNFGRAMAYLTLIYLMDIPEDAERKAVRLVATIMKDMEITRLEQGLLERIRVMLSNIFYEKKELIEEHLMTFR